MPSVVDNELRWTAYPWDREGHEWSPNGTAAGGEMLWWCGLLPRIHAHVPAARILEIGPGFGRWTQHLLGLSEHLVIVDLTARCIDHCRSKFAAYPHLECWINDGQSLEVVPDGSIDFVFSFDSLVHAEAPVLRSYVTQLARKLRPGGTGVIHHSNLQALARRDGAIPAWVKRTNWRGESMSARLFRDYCAEAGLHCVSQEIINWVSRRRRADSHHRIPGWGIPLTDTISTFARPVDGAAQPTRIYVNPRFAEEWRQMVTLAELYAAVNIRGDVPRPAAAAPVPAHPRRRTGLMRIAAGVKHRVAAAADHTTSLAAELMVAWQVRRREPIVNAIRRRECPDCGNALSAASECARCRVVYML